MLLSCFLPEDEEVLRGGRGAACEVVVLLALLHLAWVVAGEGCMGGLQGWCGGWLQRMVRIHWLQDIVRAGHLAGYGGAGLGAHVAPDVRSPLHLVQGDLDCSYI